MELIEERRLLKGEERERKKTVIKWERRLVKIEALKSLFQFIIYDS